MPDLSYPLILLGRHIGTTTGWDLDGTMCFMFYDVVPAPHAGYFPAGNIAVDLESGYVKKHIEDGTIRIFDLVELIKHLPAIQGKKGESYAAH